MVTDLIVYAHPTGQLFEQLQRFAVESRELFGPNTAHSYPVHCSLTGFFHDEPTSSRFYIEILQSLLTHHRGLGDGNRSNFSMGVDELRLSGTWFGLELSCPNLVALIDSFAASDRTPTRADDIRVKTWLHLSIAYGFGEQHGDALAELARRTINPTVPATWNIALWERTVGNQWQCHWSEPLNQPR